MFARHYSNGAQIDEKLDRPCAKNRHSRIGVASGCCPDNGMSDIINKRNRPVLRRPLRHDFIQGDCLLRLCSNDVDITHEVRDRHIFDPQAVATAKVENDI